jgi:SNF2 family DNA or RNA helicase
MKLTHPCPKCKKPARVQSEFPMGNFINYVYACGHIELRPKLKVIEEISEELNAELAKHTPAPIPTEFDLYDDLERWAADGGFIPLPEQKLKDTTQLQLENFVNESGIDERTHESYLKSLPKYIHPSYFSVDRRKCAYEFQQEGVKFAERTQLNCLIADAMGLGKTIQALIALKRNKQTAMPAIAIVRGATLFQWAHEYFDWVDPNFTCMPIIKRSHIIPGFDFYILSMDMLSKDDVLEKLLQLDLKTIVIDEVQSFKDSSAKRTKGLIKLIELGQIKYKIALSGTPIKNRVTEYGPILNILAPAYFPNLALDASWLSPDEKGRLVRLNPLRQDEFKRLISKWVIRRERFEVLKNLPALTRDYQIIEIEDKNIRNTYNHTLDLFKNWLNDTKSGINSQSLIGWLAQLRAITGQAKCKNAIEWLRDFLESTDESIAVGIQHHSVRDTLYYVLEQFGLRPLKFSGEDSIYAKNDIVRKFTSGTNRLLVINSIAGGVGLNLQTCANALVLERQWNSADEEQFECRFHRDGQQKAVTITYMIAKGTIDEFFHDMVLKKRKILVETGIGNAIDVTTDVDFLKELSNYVVNHKI